MTIREPISGNNRRSDILGYFETRFLERGAETRARETKIEKKRARDRSRRKGRGWVGPR